MSQKFECLTVESEGIGQLLPPKRTKTMTVDEFIDIATDSDEKTCEEMTDRDEIDEKATDKEKTDETE